jgi:hypothetical protein
MLRGYNGCKGGTMSLINTFVVTPQEVDDEEGLRIATGLAHFRKFTVAAEDMVCLSLTYDIAFGVIVANQAKIVIMIDDGCGEICTLYTALRHDRRTRDLEVFAVSREYFDRDCPHKGDDLRKVRPQIGHETVIAEMTEGPDWIYIPQ